MITILAKPSLISFTGNPMIYDVQSDAYVVQQGGFSLFSLQVTTADPTAGHHFTLNFNGKAITFTVSVNDDGTGCIIPPATNGNTSTWAAKIYAVFMTNYELFMNYSMTVAANIIYFTARIKGSAYDMSMTNCTVPGLNAGHIYATDQIYQSNFGILATILDANMLPIGQDFKSVDLDGKARFEISEYLRSKLSLDVSRKFTFPEDSLISHAWPSLTLPFSVIFSEKKADAVQKMLTDSKRYAIAGGLNREAQVVYNQNATDYFTSANFKQGVPFLTWQPPTKKTNKSTLEKLFFLIQLVGSPGTAQLYVKTYFTDGTDDTRSKGAAFNLTSFTVMEFSVGYDHLKLAEIDTSKVVSSWLIYLKVTANNKILTEYRGYILDTKRYRYERTFVYRNSFSAYDTIRFWGVREATNEYERTNGAVILQEKDTAENAPLRQFQNKESQKFKTTSGWLAREWKDALRELLLSTEIYEIKNGNLVRVLNDTMKVMMFRDKEDNYKLDFEYEYAHTDEFYSLVDASSQDSGEGDDELDWITADSIEFSADSTDISADMMHY